MSETEQRTDGPADPGEMSLIEHLTELRNRIGIIMIGFIAIFLKKTIATTVALNT